MSVSVGKTSIEDDVDYPERRRRIEAQSLPLNLGHLLDASAADANDRVVLNFFEAGEQLTYRQLLQRVNKLANGLLARGMGKGTHVGVMLPNIAAFPISWLALARIGAVMVPINTAYTRRELEFVLATGDVSCLIAHESCMATVREAQSGKLPDDRVFVVGAAQGGSQSWEGIGETQPDSTPPGAHEVRLSDPLNIQFTSGTTGFPKGALLSQEYWLVIGKQAAFRDGQAYQRLLASTPFFYMDPQWQLVMAMYHRATLYVAKRQSASRYMQWVREHRIQFGLLPEIVMKQPPSVLDTQNEVIRMNVYGVSKQLHAAIEQRFNLAAREAYGMTEIGSALCAPLEAADTVGTGSCGVVAPFREVRIVDEDGAPVATGEVGELQVRGRGILQSYYKNPEATAAALRDGWFRTGDLFRQDERGYFYIVGRIKDMIRRAGENVSAREVEAVIVSVPEVAEAAVVPVKDELRGEEIKAYIVLRAQTDAAEVLPRLIEHCQSSLAAFKVPRYFAFLETLPKTASEKIAKAQLIQQSQSMQQPSYDRVASAWI